MKEIVLSRDLERAAAVSIASMLLRLFYVRGYLFSGETLEIQSGSLCQLYFGGLFIDYGFDAITISLQIMITLLEAVLIISDIVSGVEENLTVLVSRATTGKIYRIMLLHMFRRNLLLIMFEYIIFLLIEREIPESAHLLIVADLLLTMIVLQLISIMISFLFRNSFGYVWALLIYYGPVLFVGFSYSIGNEAWKTGRYFILQYGTYNWFHAATVSFPEFATEWNSITFHLSDSCSLLVMAAMCAALYMLGEKSLKRSSKI